MTLLYDDLRGDEPAMRVWRRLAADTIRAVPQLRMEEDMKRSVLVGTVVVLLGVAAAGVMTGSFFIGGLLLAGIAAFIAVPSAVIARRNRASAERAYAVRSWPWWSYVAAAIAVLYLVFGVGQLIADPKVENVAALFAMIVLSSMIAGGLALRRKGRVGGNWLIITGALPLFPVYWLVWPPVLATLAMVGAMSEVFAGRQPRPI